MKRSYNKSNEYFDRAEKIIPLASQTFSKSVTQYPKGVSPLFLEKGKGARVWDVDGNEYIDFVNALLCVNLGYGYEEVDNAVIRKIREGGVSFSLPHLLEYEVAEKIVDLVPCAEKVRFGKNGSDATSAAIRLGRAFTKKDGVAVCGYHGWQDWYIGSTSKNEGVPSCVSKLTHKFEYNNIESLEELFENTENDIGVVILEPMNVFFPKDNFLEKVKEVTRKYGAILVFDETITGFRFAKGGAQQLFDVTPDLATFGKGLANGYPLSAVCGKAEIMDKMEDIFFSGTFGGETVSLAAAKATLEVIDRENVTDKVTKLGELLMSELRKLIQLKSVGDIFDVGGHPVWSFLMIKDTEKYSSYDIKSILMKEILERGIISIGTHNLSYSHDQSHIKTLLDVYSEVFDLIRVGVNNSSLLDNFNGDVLKPLFKVR
ncbi:MAG: aspartate aminotransferase family protein [Halobacteriovoraceae bacterium]|nr:aspartate aminotransferase family protein [Halobacteriovoraceae bacterium]